MSDSKSSYGEPVEESTAADDDVVGSVNESLADAEAAGREAVAEPDARAAEPETVDAPVEPAASESAGSDDEIVDYAAYTAALNAASADDDAPAAAPVAHDADTHAHESAVAAEAYGHTTEAPAAVVASEPVEPVVAAPVTPQPIFVQAPEAPRPRGNRAAAGAIGLLATLAFAVLYLGSWLGIGLLNDEIEADAVVPAIQAALASWLFWTPVVFFYLGFWLLGAIINRGRWGHWVIFGIFVGFFAYAGYVVGELIQAPFWTLTPTEGVELVQDRLFSPAAIAAFIFARELTIWFGAWVSARGKRVTELNLEAQREYERTLEAGPQLYRH